VAETVEEQKDFLSKTLDNNVYIEYDNISVVVSKSMETKILLLWNGFDADWDNWAFTRTKRRIEKDLK